MAELVREHADLAAVVGFVREHVAEHLGARGQSGPAVAAKLLNAPALCQRRRRSASISSHRVALSANALRACCGVQCARLSCAGTFRWGAVSLIHLVRTLCMWVKIAAMVRTLPGGFAVQTAGSRCSISIWFRRSLAANICTAARPS